MSECGVMRETMPFLLTESLDGGPRELAHQHIENCEACGAEWASYRETWGLLGELPEVDVPARVRARFLGAVQPPATRGDNVVPFQRRPAAKWLAQAAAVVLLAGGAYFAGNRTRTISIPRTGPVLTSVQPYSLAETRVLPAALMSPTIEGRPNIQNVQFVDADPTDNQVGVSFDVTSRVTVNGTPADKSLVRLLTYVLENEQSLGPSRTRAIEWVKQTYGDRNIADPEIASSLAKVLRNDEHEGVRIRAVDTLTSLPSSGTSETRDALIAALKSDPNPAVRIKAVEALVTMARNGDAFDPKTVDTLRQKAAQDDENLYVRVKAAEVLSSIRPQ